MLHSLHHLHSSLLERYGNWICMNQSCVCNSLFLSRIVPANIVDAIALIDVVRQSPPQNHSFVHNEIRNRIKIASFQIQYFNFMVDRNALSGPHIGQSVRVKALRACNTMSHRCSARFKWLERCVRHIFILFGWWIKAFLINVDVIECVRSTTTNTVCQWSCSWYMRPLTVYQIWRDFRPEYGSFFLGQIADILMN